MNFRSIVQFYLVCAFMLTNGLNAQQLDSVRVFYNHGRQLGVVQVLNDEGTIFIALNEIAKLCSLRVVELPALMKMEVSFPSLSLKVVSNNPFITQTNHKTKKQTIVQLTVPIIQQGQFWFASKYFVETLFRQQFDSTFRFDTVMLSSELRSPPTPLVSNIDVEEKKNGIMVRIHSSEKVFDFSKSLQIEDWLYVTLPGAKISSDSLGTIFQQGLVRQIKAEQMETAVLVSFQLRKKISTSDLVQDQTSNDVLLTLIFPEEHKQETVKPIVKNLPDRPTKNFNLIGQIEKQKNKWKLDVVVIDAGHGGHDPGAIGVIGTREKDITLGISLKLGELIEKQMPDLKVVYTRKTDRFVELFRRGQIANESEGKLFISIHCNSLERKPSSIRGFEIYLLRPGKTEDAIQIAEKENEVVKLEKDYENRYQELTEENFIILTMAQSSYVKQSEHFAEMLSETMSEKFESPDRAVKQAGFYVLVGASMPNVLIETGYLSNPKDERALRSPQGQKVVAETIAKALKAFKRQYEKDL